MCRFNHLGNDNQSGRKAVYDDLQSDWVKEYIDLKDYLGKKIKIRFVLHSDQGLEKDGFYFDDMKVEVLGSSVGIPDLKLADIVLQNLPNPCVGNTKIIYQLPKDNSSYNLIVTNQMGRTIQNITLDKTANYYNMNVSLMGSGMYFYKIISNTGQSSSVKKMAVLE